VENSPHLNLITLYLTVAYDGACSPNVSVRMASFSFGPLHFRKRNVTPLSFCCFNRERRLTSFLSVSVTSEDLQFGT